MLGKSPNQNQIDIFKSTLKQLLNPKDEYVLLAAKIDWQSIENEFIGYYSNVGTPSKPIRLMVGLLLIKHLENLSDERVVEAWVRNPYFQYLCGEQHMKWAFPCDPSDLVHFRNRIGVDGVERIFQMTVQMNKCQIADKSDILVDTTVQEKNITFPTDTKLYLKIIQHCWRIAQSEQIKLRQSYVRVVPALRQEIKFSHHPKRRKKANKAKRRLKTLAGRLYRNVFDGLNQKSRLDGYDDLLGAMGCILQQTKFDKDKIYSIHEPTVSCIAKGKAHKQYEFGNKVSLAVHAQSHVIVGVQSFTGNPYDGHTLLPTLEHVERTTGFQYPNVIVDLGYRGCKTLENTRVVNPATKTKNAYQKRKKRKQLRQRAGIEPIISHVKHDHRMLKNYLKGVAGDNINALLASAAFNLKIWMKNAISFALFWLKRINRTNHDNTTYEPQYYFRTVVANC